jgi:four helix bundle protein
MDFRRFIEIAYGSLLETVSELRVPQKQGLVNTQTYKKVYLQAENVAKMLSGLRQSLRK